MARTKPSSLRYYLDGPPAPEALEGWKLQLSGNGKNVSITMDDVSSACELVHQARRFVCVCNWSIAQTWDGYRLADVLSTFLDFDGDGTGIYLYERGIGTHEKGQYDTSVNLAQSLTNVALLVVGIDGEPLTLERGAPMRFVDFTLFGYKLVKGLQRLEFRDKPYQGPWEIDKGYDWDGTVYPRRYSCIDLNCTVLLNRVGEQPVDPKQ